MDYPGRWLGFETAVVCGSIWGLMRERCSEVLDMPVPGGADGAERSPR